jgi:hypothetical protein
LGQGVNRCFGCGGMLTSSQRFGVYQYFTAALKPEACCLARESSHRICHRGDMELSDTVRIMMAWGEEW